MKKNIEMLEIAIDNSRYSFEEFEYYQSLDKSTMEAVENLIKAYKELEEELISKHHQYEQWRFAINHNYISKDKIREKINKLEREKQFLEDNKMKDKTVYTPYQIVNAQILRLKELLEEE